MKMAIILVFCTLLAPSAATASDLRGEKIILIGDSQVEGVWSDIGPELEGILTKRGATVLRLGIGGSSSKVWYKTLLGERHLFSKKLPWTLKWTYSFLKAYNPDQIIVSLGGNSSWIGNYGENEGAMGAYHFKYTLPLMKELQQVTSNVIWFGPAHRWDSGGPKTREALKRGRKKTDYFLKYYANLVGIEYISMLDWSLKDEDMQRLTPKEKRYDGVHYRGFAAECYAFTMASNIKTQLINNMKRLLENWQKHLHEEIQHYEMIVAIKSQPDTSLYGTIYNRIRGLDGVTIVKTTRAAEKDNAGNKISTLNIKFLMTPGTGDKYLSYVKDAIKSLKDEQGDRILGVRILKIPEKIKQ